MFVRPEEIIKSFGLQPGMVVADFGCGSGYYSLAAGKIVGDRGRVYAIDVQKELLAAVKSSAEINNLKNLEIIWADIEAEGGSRLADGSVDFVMVSNILFQAGEKEIIAKEANRILKNKGKVAVIEWDKLDKSVGKIGPSSEKRISKEEAQALFFQNGFIMEKEFQAGDGHYGLIFIKS